MSKGVCQTCGGPVQPVRDYYYNKFCCKACRKRSVSNSSFPICPVEGCRQPIQLATLVVCSGCWFRVPLHLREAVATASHAFRHAGHSDHAEKLAELDEAKDSAIAAAEGRLQRESEIERKRARRRDLVRHSTRHQSAA